MFLKILTIILCSALYFYIVITTLTFFGIELEMYINFLVWFLALIIFYCILPKNTENIFSN